MLRLIMKLNPIGWTNIEISSIFRFLEHVVVSLDHLKSKLSRIQFNVPSQQYGSNI